MPRAIKSRRIADPPSPFSQVVQYSCTVQCKQRQRGRRRTRLEGGVKLSRPPPLLEEEGGGGKVSHGRRKRRTTTFSVLLQSLLPSVSRIKPGPDTDFLPFFLYHSLLSWSDAPPLHFLLEGRRSSSRLEPLFCLFPDHIKTLKALAAPPPPAS